MKNPTLSKRLWLLWYYPMTTLYILYLESWEEASNNWEHVVSNVVAFGAPDKQGRAIVARFFWILEWKIAHKVEACAKYIERYPKAHRLSIVWAHQVREEELTDRKSLQVWSVISPIATIEEHNSIYSSYLLVFLEYSVGLNLLGYICIFYAPQPLYVLGKLTLKRCVDWSVVDWDESFHEPRGAKRKGPIRGLAFSTLTLGYQSSRKLGPRHRCLYCVIVSGEGNKGILTWLLSLPLKHVSLNVIIESYEPTSSGQSIWRVWDRDLAWTPQRRRPLWCNYAPCRGANLHGFEDPVRL